jgi:hypothetical protein
MLPWLGLSIDDVASVMNLTLVYGIGNIILVLAAPTPHCGYIPIANHCTGPNWAISGLLL